MAQYGLNTYFPMAPRVVGRNENADNGFGSYAWPGGVPSSLLGTAKYGDVKITVRKELVQLFEVLYEITDLMGYKIYAKNPNGSGENWGPWSYENRPIGGTKSASNHSRGRATDNNSPQNPQSYTFISTWPPAVINVWEQCGFRWGGRYKNPTKFDTMHLNYAGMLDEIQSDLVRARQLRDRLRGTVSPAGPQPAPQPTAPVVVADGNGWPLPGGQYFGPSNTFPSNNGKDNQAELNVVAEFQDQLNKLGYSAGAPDGRYGQKTQAAALAWQKVNGMPLSGLCGLNDYIAIHSTHRKPNPPQSAAPAFGGVLLRQGSAGAAVKTMQERLNAHLDVLEVANIEEDGKFGPGTERAVRIYQGVREHTHNLGEPDGVVGRKTWDSLWN